MGNGQTATRFEWITAAVGGVLTLATIGFLGYEGITQRGDAMPEVLVEVDTIAAQRGGWLVRVETRNVGTATAASVRIVGELRSDTGVVETSEMTLDYVPEASSRSGGLLFTRDPSGFTLDIRPTGYERP